MKRHRNPSFPTGLVIGAVLGAGALVYWATRKTTTATLQAMNAAPPQQFYVGERAPGMEMSYADTSHPLYNPPPGSSARPLTPAEIAAIAASQFNAPLLPAEQAMLAQQRAALAGGRTPEAEQAATMDRLRNGGTPGVLT
jgi:hypothetical protein